MQDVNAVTLLCRLTKDPELRHTASGMPVCSMRVAFSTSRKNAAGEWEDKSNFIDVTVWGKQGESCATYLSKGKQCAVRGRLEWSEWDSSDGSGKRQKHEIVADQVQFIGGKDEGGGYGGSAPSGDFGAPAPAADFGAGSPTDDDIPF